MPSGMWNGIVVVRVSRISVAFSETFTHTLVSERDRLVGWLSYHHIHNPPINFMTLHAHIQHTTAHIHWHPLTFTSTSAFTFTCTFTCICISTSTPHPHSRPHSHSHPITFRVDSTILILSPPHHPLPLVCTPCKTVVPGIAQRDF